MHEDARFDDAETTQGLRPAFRVDQGTRLAKLERVAGGGVRVPATIARVGIYEYQRADGGVTRELLPPEEAARLDSLRTLRDAPVTVMHPAGKRMVSPETYRSDNVGHVSGEPMSDGKRVTAELVIQDAATIKRIDGGELVEVSPGYRVLLDPTPGVWNGQRYDAVQRRREYNHVAIGPSGWARGGSEASLRIDGVDDVAVERTPTGDLFENREPSLEQRRVDGAAMKTEKIDGIEYEIGSAAWSQARARHDAKVESDLATALKAATEAKAAADALQAKLDGAEKRIKELEAELAPEKLDGRAAARATLIVSARSILGTEAKLDGKGELDIMREALAKACPELKLDGKSDDYVRARFEVEVERVAGVPKSQSTQRSPLSTARKSAVGGETGKPRLDADEGWPLDFAHR